jgi:hypothetical protein
MTAPIMNRHARRAAKITGAMIDHAVTILEAAYHTYTHIEDGETFVCIGCIAKCLRANWDQKVQRPRTTEHWETLGSIALDLVMSEEKIEDQALVLRQLH